MKERFRAVFGSSCEKLLQKGLKVVGPKKGSNRIDQHEKQAKKGKKADNAAVNTEKAVHLKAPSAAISIYIYAAGGNFSQIP